MGAVPTLDGGIRMRSDAREHEREDRWAAVLQARRAAPPTASPACSATATRRWCSSPRCSSGFAVLVAVSLAPRPARDPRAARDVSGLGAADDGAIRQLVAERSAFLDDRLDGRLDRRRRARAADPRRARRDRLRVPQALADRRVRRVRAVDRVGDLPRHVPRPPAPAPVRAAPRGPARRTRATRPATPRRRSPSTRASSAPRLRRGQPRRADRRLGAGDRAPDLRRDVAHVPRHAPPARRRGRPRSSASARCGAPVRVPRRGAAERSPARERRTARAARRAAGPAAS